LNRLTQIGCAAWNTAIFLWEGKFFLKTGLWHVLYTVDD